MGSPTPATRRFTVRMAYRHGTVCVVVSVVHAGAKPEHGTGLITPSVHGRCYLATDTWTEQGSVPKPCHDLNGIKLYD